MDAKHTPGPWMLNTVATTCGICHKVGPFPPAKKGGKDRHACLYADYASDSNPADRELLANARLIAAAPNLLEALQDVLSRIKKSEEWWMDCPDRGGFDAEAIGAAIAKATGGQE
jgi:hypothetical protein